MIYSSIEGEVLEEVYRVTLDHTLRKTTNIKEIFACGTFMNRSLKKSESKHFALTHSTMIWCLENFSFLTCCTHIFNNMKGIAIRVQQIIVSKL